VYDKDAALKQDKQSGRKLQRVGEAVLENGVWRVNDEMVCLLMPLSVYD
jgi:hypothetical protein